MRIGQFLTIAGLTGAMLLGPVGCETMEQHKIASGATIGAVSGAALGGIIGHQSGHTAGGAAIGALAGGALGAGVGYYLDRQAKQFQRIENMQVEKVPASKEVDPVTHAPEPEHLTLRMSNEVLFDPNSAALRPEGNAKLRETAQILKQYPKSRVIVKGYTSAEGTERRNQELSEERAKSVANTLMGYEVESSRVTAVGLGSSEPIADNQSPAGRAQNRRVEIDIIPTEEAGR